MRASRAATFASASASRAQCSSRPASSSASGTSAVMLPKSSSAPLPASGASCGGSGSPGAWPSPVATGGRRVVCRRSISARRPVPKPSSVFSSIPYCSASALVSVGPETWPRSTRIWPSRLPVVCCAASASSSSSSVRKPFSTRSAPSGRHGCAAVTSSLSASRQPSLSPSWLPEAVIEAASDAGQADFLAPLAGEEVDPVDEAHPVAARAHDERARPGAVGEELDAAQEVAVRDAGRGDDRLSGRQVVEREDAVHVLDPLLARPFDLAPGRRPELCLDLAAEAAQRGGRHDGLARAADPDREMVVRATDRGRDRGGDVAVLDELDAGAGGSDVLDQVVVARAVEDDRRDVVRAPPEGLGDRADVVPDRPQ